MLKPKLAILLHSKDEQKTLCIITLDYIRLFLYSCISTVVPDFEALPHVRSIGPLHGNVE